MNPNYQKESISRWQIICILTLVLVSEGIITTGYKLSDNGAWLSVIIAATVNILMCIVYAFILKRNEGKSIYDIFEKVFGKWIGKVFVLIFIMYTIYLSVVATKSVALQIVDLSLRETPHYYVLLFFMISYCMLLCKGIEVIARMSCIFFILILVTYAVILFLLYNNIEIFHLKPMIAAPLKDIARGGAFDYFVMFGDSAILLGVVLSNQHPKKPNSKNNILKGLIIGTIIAGLLNSLIIIISIMVLGFPLYNYLYYPISMVLSTIDIALFITRIEVLSSLFFLTALIMKAVVALYVAIKGCQKLFGTKHYNQFVIPIKIIVYVISLLMFESIEQVIAFRDKYGWLKGIAQVLIPIVVAAFLLFQKKQEPLLDHLENKETALVT